MIREPRVEDADSLNTFFVQLDNETRFMLFEPGERSVTLAGQQAFLQKALDDRNPLILVAEEDQRIVGFCGMRRELLRRNRHCSSLVIGVLENHRGKGIGKGLLRESLQRAQTQGIERVELTVVAENTKAIGLYEALGFRKEGLRENSLKIDGRFVSEYYMGLTLGESPVSVPTNKGEPR